MNPHGHIEVLRSRADIVIGMAVRLARECKRGNECALAACFYRAVQSCAAS